MRAAALLGLLVISRSALADGEPVEGFPNWGERVVLEWINRSRVDPNIDLAGCTNCSDLGCYTPQPPLAWAELTNRSARFHADEMTRQGFFTHDSHCHVVGNISSLYPTQCDGSASCACAGGVSVCDGGCTAWFARIELFGAGPSGEIQAGTADPNQAFYLWIDEPLNSGANTCGFQSGQFGTNGHRFLILTSQGALGAGVSGTMSVGDFTGGGPPGKIASGSHYPRQGDPIDVWANWADAAGPTSALLNVDGACQPMNLERGTAENGAWHAVVTGMASGCHRYSFEFTDASGQPQRYPTTGSLGIGDSSCPDWESASPLSCAGEVVPGGDAGADVDAGGNVDAGGGFTSGPSDAGLPAVGHPDGGGNTRATTADAGRPGGPSQIIGQGGGCGCSGAPGAGAAWLLLAMGSLVREARMRNARNTRRKPPPNA